MTNFGSTEGDEGSMRLIVRILDLLFSDRGFLVIIEEAESPVETPAP